MNLKFATLLFILIGSSLGLRAQETFNEASFFKSLESDDLNLIDAELATVQKSSIKEKEAYTGALLMKKAGLVPKVKAKLASFKDGKAKLEHAISQDSDNPTYRFLRLIIQENAPNILNYNNNIKEDSLAVSSKFGSFSAATQTAVTNYSKQSKVLDLEKAQAGANK